MYERLYYLYYPAYLHHRGPFPRKFNETKIISGRFIQAQHTQKYQLINHTSQTRPPAYCFISDG